MFSAGPKRLLVSYLQDERHVYRPEVLSHSVFKKVTGSIPTTSNVVEEEIFDKIITIEGYESLCNLVPLKSFDVKKIIKITSRRMYLFLHVRTTSKARVINEY